MVGMVDQVVTVVDSQEMVPLAGRVRRAVQEVREGMPLEVRVSLFLFREQVSLQHRWKSRR